MNFVDLRQFAKYVLDNLGIIITQNQRYDKYTREVIQSTLKPDSNSIDVGCHKGEILDIILKFKWSLLYYCFQTEFYNYIYNNQYDKKISKKKLKIEFISKINQILLLSKLEFEHNKELLNDFNDMILIIIKPLEI